MAKRRSRIDGLRPPFVVTVAVAAGGCGGTVTGSQGRSDDGTGAGAGTGGLGTGATTSTGGVVIGGGFTGAGGTVNPPPPPQTTCPGTEPSTGMYCNYVGQPCSYGPLCGSFPTRSASCVDHTWIMSGSSCNPPAPPTALPDCDNPVAAGTPCSQPSAH